MGMHEHRFKAPGIHDRAWHYLLGLGPDLAFLQETLPPTWARGQGRLVSEAFDTWGSVIFSPHYPLTRVQLPEGNPLRRFGAYLAHGVVTLPDGIDARVVSVHARANPASDAQLAGLDRGSLARESVGQPMVNDLIFAGLAEMLGSTSRFIVAGDWNTGRTQANAKAGEEFFRRVETQHWFECTQKEVQTWFREGDKLIQDDHAFCDEPMSALFRDAWAPSDPVLRLGLSDHAPLVVEFEVPSVAMENL
jgi:endonuclease/exonuclease/phosphatase (EEP) superfamily protein YafD